MNAGKDATRDSPEAIQLALTRLQTHLSPEARATALATFKPRSTDVIIATPIKSGTTWMQQIVHGLRSGGSMDFDEISQVVPFIEVSHMIGIDLDADQVAEPRAFKTHEYYDHCPKGAGKYIVIIRDPLDAFPSSYSFFNGRLIQPVDSVSPDAFLGALLENAGKPPSSFDERFDLYYTIESWWKRRHDDNVRIFFYEDMMEDLAGVVKDVSEYIGCGVGDEALQALVVKQASKDFMLAHRVKFDQYSLKSVCNRSVGVPDKAGCNAENATVRDARYGIHRGDLSADLVAKIKSAWKRLEEVTGCSSYSDLRKKYGRKAASIN